MPKVNSPLCLTFFTFAWFLMFMFNIYDADFSMFDYEGAFIVV